MTSVDKLDGFNEFIKSNPLVVVMFYRDECGFCRIAKPIFTELAAASQRKFKDKAKFVFVGGNAEDIFSDQKIEGVPTFKVFKNGRQIDEEVGANIKNIKNMFARNGILAKNVLKGSKGFLSGIAKSKKDSLFKYAKGFLSE